MLSKRILVLMFLLLFLPLVGCFPPPTNQAPILTSDPITTATVGVAYAYNVNATDPDGDTLTYSLDLKPSGMTINSANGLIKWTPTAKGDNPIIVKVSDGTLSITQSFTIVVSKPPLVNQAPTIYSTPIITAKVGMLYTYDVDATDPNGDTLTYSLDLKPNGMTINSANGVIIWIPTLTQVGNKLVTVKASDGVLSDTQSFIITVSTVEFELTGIVVVPKTMTLTEEGSKLITSVTAHYSDGSTVSITLGSCTYASSAINIATVSNGLITAVAEGTATITVSYGGKSDTIVVTVNEPPAPLAELTNLWENLEADFKPEFAPGVHEYSLAAILDEKTITLTATTDLEDATIEYDYEYIQKGTVAGKFNLFVGKNIITITVKKDGYQTTTYTITVTRASLPVNNVSIGKYYATIQEAIDEASTGNTIYVSAGIYPEAITIDKDNLILQSETWLGAIIRPIIPQTDMQEAAIRINANGVTIDGFEIDGTTLAVNGICGWNTSGLTIKNNKIHGAVSAWDGCGILLMSWSEGGTVYNNLIENNEVYDTGRMGIMVMDYGDTYSVTSGNTITGNTVYDVWKEAWQEDHGGGIQINVGKDCAITNNEVYDVQNDMWGIYMFGSAGGNTITENTFRNNEIGIHLWISGEGGTTIDWGSETPASPQVHYNNIYDNSYGAININKAGTIMVMDATNNWWGHTTGPHHADTNPSGLGNAVSDNVDFDPWTH